jgi:glycyl-tRNA synthetase beta chain
MVGEFPELQGLMGRYYAEAAGHDDGVPEACEEHYKPLGPGDAVPSAPVSVAVALADKLDTLTGFWAIDEKPTGSKDPYALRRAALGVIRLVLANGVRLKIAQLFSSSFQVFLLPESLTASISRDVETLNNLSEQISTFGVELNELHRFLDLPSRSDLTDALVKRNLNSISDMINDSWTVRRRLESAKGALDEGSGALKSASNDLLAFLHDRLKVHLKDEGLRYDVIDACLAMPGNDDLTLLVKRATALGDFLKTEDGENLVQGFKRANNILTQAEEKDGVEYSFGADVKFAETEEEKALFAALDTAEPQITQALTAEDFAAAMGGMAKLRAPIDAFFEAVQVNVDNAVLRRNRLNLLSRIRDICRQAADLTKLEG